VERYVLVLDWLPNGRATDRGFHREPLAIGLGESELKLLELVPRPGRSPTVGERAPLGAAPGDPPGPFDHVRRRIGYEELTTSARAELEGTLKRVVTQDPARFLRFFNESPSVSRRFHLLELLPGIGKKTMQAIVEERRRAPFASFQDIEARLHLKEPEQLIVARILEEMSGAARDKYRLFVAQ
jgi:putative nucleotide binding protein